MYKCIRAFSDRADGYHVYNPGDVYPRPGVTLKPERVAELAGWGNALGHPLIEGTTEEDKPKRGRPPKREVNADDDGDMPATK